MSRTNTNNSPLHGRAKAKMTMAKRCRAADKKLIDEGYLSIEDLPSLEEYLEISWATLALQVSAI